MTPEELRSILHYDPDTGVFTWLVSNTNRVKVGDVAGYVGCRGRIEIRAGGKLRLAHRLAWYYVHGKWPTYGIDHINGNPSDNRLVNLRDIPQQQNLWNSAMRAGNTSGHKGVSYCKERRKWYAQIQKNGKRISLGRYDTIEEAVVVYKKAEAEIYGEFARTA